MRQSPANESVFRVPDEAVEHYVRLAGESCRWLLAAAAQLATPARRTVDERSDERQNEAQFPPWFPHFQRKGYLLLHTHRVHTLTNYSATLNSVQISSNSYL